ncbi:hypothetical protein BH11MYX4_BH11MYX4_32600 [soil metagenome]
MPSFDSISFDTAGLTLQGEKNGARVWHTEAGDGIGLFLFDKAPDIGADLGSLDSVRAFYRALAADAGLALIEVDTPEIDDRVATRTIFKAPQEPTGMTYLGSITLPFRDFSFVLKMQCREHGTTGMRDVVVLEAMLGKGQVTLREDGTMKGWMQDPYDPSFQAPLLRNLSDDETYDALFPEHPLSRLRSTLRALEPTLRLSGELKSAPPFVRSQPPAQRPWWKMW